MKLVIVHFIVKKRLKPFLIYLFLINLGGICFVHRYRDNFQCYYFFTETYQYNNNTYIKKMRCNYLNTCKACKELTLLIGKYFPQKLIERLRILK